MHSQTFSLNPVESWTAQLRAGLHNVISRIGPREPAAVAADPHREAEALRSYAATFVDSDPRFADDLFAAADRHELGVH